ERLREERHHVDFEIGMKTRHEFTLCSEIAVKILAKLFKVTEPQRSIHRVTEEQHVGILPGHCFHGPHQSCNVAILLYLHGKVPVPKKTSILAPTKLAQPEAYERHGPVSEASPVGRPSERPSSPLSSSAAADGGSRGCGRLMIRRPPRSEDVV